MGGLNDQEKGFVVLVHQNVVRTIDWMLKALAMEEDLIKHLRDDERFLADLMEKNDKEPETTPNE